MARSLWNFFCAIEFCILARLLLMRFLPCIQTRKPKFWYISGGIVAFVGVVCFIASIVVKTALFDSVKRGIYSMRFIDDPTEVSGCENMVLSDATCSGKRFEAWSMSSNEKHAMCMSDSAPLSKVKGAASKWCSVGYDEGCSKPGGCVPGQSYDFYFFSVSNPLEVMDGHPAEMVEMEPVRFIKSVDRVDIDTSDLSIGGVISWKEAHRYELADESRRWLLDQEVVIPNPAMFGSALRYSDGLHVAADAVTYLVAAATFYTKMQEMINTKAKLLERILPPQLREQMVLFSGRSRIDFSKFVQDQYHRGTFALAFGAIANTPICPALFRAVTELFGNPLPDEISEASVCSSIFEDNIGFSMFTPLTKSFRISFSPSDSPFFYEFEKACHTFNSFPDYACYLRDVCPEGGDCLNPLLTTADANALFELFTNLGNPDTLNLEHAIGFLAKCSARGYVLERSKCDLVREQLMRVGRSVYATSNNPLYRKLLQEYGWSKNTLDLETAKRAFPYFIKGTIAELTGFGLYKPRRDSVSKSPIGPQMLVNTLFTNGTSTGYSYGPVGVFLGSNAGDKVGKFAHVKGRLFGCAYDSGCRAQREYFESDGETCVPDEVKCLPEIVRNGHDAGFFKGSIFEDESRPTRVSMFMPEMMMSGEFVKKESNAEWINGLRVDKWELDRIPAMAQRNCQETRPGFSRAIACDSPVGTLNIGHQLAAELERPLKGKRLMGPLTVLPSAYASFPHYLAANVQITACKSCASNRDFTIRIYTEPETGAQVLGNQKIQVNVRVSPNNGPGWSTKGLFMKEDLDVFVPVFWMNRFDQAAPFQATKLAQLQSLPKTVNIVFGSLLALSLILAACAVWMLKRAQYLKRAQNFTTISFAQTGKSTPCANTDKQSTISDGRSSQEDSTPKIPAYV